MKTIVEKPTAYLWKECLSREATRIDDNSYRINEAYARVFEKGDPYVGTITELHVYCTSPTQFQITRRKLSTKVNKSSYWRTTRRLVIDLDKVQIYDIKKSGKNTVCRNCTYSLQTYNSYMKEILVDIIGAEALALFDIKYGHLHMLDRYKSAWRGETLKDVLKRAKLPTNKSVVRALGALLTRSYNVTNDRWGPDMWGDQPYLPDLTVLSFIWYVVQDVNIFVQCLSSWRRDTHIQHGVKPNKRMFRKFYQGLDRNQKVQFSNSLIHDVFLIPDTLHMISNNSIDINTTLIADKTIGGIHDIANTFRRAPVHQASVDTTISRVVLEFKKLDYLHDVELPTGLKLEYPGDRTVLEEYGERHHNCVGSYAGRVERGDSIVLGVYREHVHMYTAEIDVRERRLIQLRGVCNADAPKEEEAIVQAYIAEACNKNNLQPSDVRVLPDNI